MAVVFCITYLTNPQFVKKENMALSNYVSFMIITILICKMIASKSAVVCKSERRIGKFFRYEKK